jgi:hypothetical protein
LVVSWAILSWLRAWTNFLISGSAPTKLVPLSDIIYTGVPLLDTIRVKALMNEAVSNEYDIARRTALVARQVNRHRYLFALALPRPCFVRNEPP